MGLGGQAQVGPSGAAGAAAGADGPRGRALPRGPRAGEEVLHPGDPPAEGTVVLGTYKTQLYDPPMEKYQPSPQWIKLFMLVKDPKNKAIHLDMQLGEHTDDDVEFATKDKLSQLHLRVRQLVEQVAQIQKEQEYQRWREEHFRQTSESTNQRVLWWSILQTLILVAVGVWQMRHLKSFFEAKKLV